jgi:uncharacterized protein (DUF1778 family)
MRVKRNQERLTTNLNIRIKPSIKELIKSKAEEREMTISELVEMAILKEIGPAEKDN